MKTILLYALSLTLSIAVCARQLDDGHPHIPTFKGPVKSVIQTTDSVSLKATRSTAMVSYYDRYDFDKKQRCLYHEAAFCGRHSLSIRFSFDDSAHAEDIVTFDPLYPDSLRSHIIYHYRSDGRLRHYEAELPRRSHFSADYDSLEMLAMFTDSLYDPSRTSSKNGIVHHSTFRNSYDAKGQLLRQEIYIHDTLDKIESFIYDTLGNEISRQTTNPYGKLIAKTLSTYDQLSRVTGQSYFAPQEVHHSTITYNRNNDLSELIYYKPSGAIQSKTTYKYRYDKYHNWIERKTFFTKASYKVVKDKTDKMLDQQSALMKGHYFTQRVITYY